MDRRDFLSSRQIAAGAGQLLAAADELRRRARSRRPPPEPQEFALLRFSRRAMATTFEVMLPFGTPDALPAAEAALDEIDRLEAQLTAYRDTSESAASTAPPPTRPSRRGRPVRPALDLGAPRRGERRRVRPHGRGAHQGVGFYRGPRRVPSDAERAAALERVGMRHVLLDPERRSIRYLRHGLEINLGSIGKGYALDRAAPSCASAGICRERCCTAAIAACTL